MTPLHRISALPTNHRLRSVVSIWSLKARPTMAMGMQPTATAMPKRKSRVSRSRAWATPWASAVRMRTMSPRR